MRINVLRIIELKNIELKTVEKLLFPHVERPHRALKRVTDGEAQLNEEQIALLAKYVGCTVDELYDPWGASKVDPTTGEWIFHNLDYEVRLNVKEGRSRIFKKGTMIVTEVVNNMSIPFSQYFENVEKTIKDYEQSHPKKGGLNK